MRTQRLWFDAFSMPKESRVILTTHRMRALSYLVMCAIAAFVARGQPTAGPSQADAERAQQEYQDQLRRSTLVGPDSDLAMRFPNGELTPLGTSRGCQPPVTKGGLIKVDCTMLDGPAHYFDQATRAMVESCSFWFTDAKRCPPKAWTVDVPGCDGEIPERITGAWRFYAVPTAGGFAPVDAGWTMTLVEQSITFAFTGFAQVERSYTVLEQDNQRYSLELRDDRAATSRVYFELAPCGLFVEAEPTCDAYCENFADEFEVPSEEQIRDIARQMAGGQDGALMEQIVATIRESIANPQPIFPERAFFVGM